MADTTTTLLGLTKPGIDESDNTWGGKLNDNFDDIDLAIKNRRVDETPTTGGTTAAHTLALTHVPALYDGLTFTARLGFNLAAAATLNVNGLGAKVIQHVNLNTGLGTSTNVPAELCLTGEVLQFSYYAAGNSGNGAFVITARPGSNILDVQYLSENTAGALSSNEDYTIAAGAGATFYSRRANSSAMIHWIARLEVNPGTNTTKDVGIISVLRYFDGSAYQIAGSSTSAEILHSSTMDTSTVRAYVSGHALLTTSHRRSDNTTQWTVRPYAAVEYTGNSGRIISWSAVAIIYTP